MTLQEAEQERRHGLEGHSVVDFLTQVRQDAMIGVDAYHQQKKQDYLERVRREKAYTADLERRREREARLIAEEKDVRFSLAGQDLQVAIADVRKYVRELKLPTLWWTLFLYCNMLLIRFM